MVGLPEGKKKLKGYNTGVWQIDGQTDGQTSYHGIVRAMHTRGAVKTARWGIITGPPSFKRHSQYTVRFIYMKISGNFAEGLGLWSLQIKKYFVFWLTL